MTSVAGAPNVLWICTDQQRYDTIGALGNAHIRTPNLDRLAATGVAFTRAYCQSPVCTPSRASMLTGRYPSAINVNRNGNAYFPAEVPLVTKVLADAGYDCGLAGKLHLAAAWNGQEQRTDDGFRCFWYSHSPVQGFRRGNQYTDWLEERGALPRAMELDADGRPLGYRPDIPVDLHQTTWCAERAIEFMTQPRRRPWLMCVNIYDPHSPFDAPAQYRDRYRTADLPPPLFSPSDADVQRRLADVYFQSTFTPPGAADLERKASYYGMIELVDEQVGRMLDALDRSGQRDTTLVIFTSDHGEILGDHGLGAGKGCRFYEGLVRVPLIFSWPGVIGSGLLADALVELVDIAPTLAELAGVTLGHVDGRSLVPILTGTGDPGKHRTHVRCEYYDALNPWPVEENERHVPAWATMYRDHAHKLVVHHGLDYGELYDMRTDPSEFDNLWDRPDAREIKTELLKHSFDATITVADVGPPRLGRY